MNHQITDKVRASVRWCCLLLCIGLVAVGCQGAHESVSDVAPVQSEGSGGGAGASGQGGGGGVSAGSAGQGSGSSGGAGGKAGAYGSAGAIPEYFGGSSSGCDPAAGFDQDNDGWSIAEGDCNDCEPGVNPGAIDLLELDETGLPLALQVDNDCDGAPSQVADVTSCDAMLEIESKDPFDPARAIGLCNVGVEENPSDPKQRKWGVLRAGFNKIFGPFLSTPLTPTLNAGILDGFGPATKPREGARLLGLSSGVARAEGHPGYDKNLCRDGGKYAQGEDFWPPGFPKGGACGEMGTPGDGIAYEVEIRVPTNARSLSFRSRFYSCEYPAHGCHENNDVFAVLMIPTPLAPDHPMNDALTNSANLVFDEKNSVFGLNSKAFFTACDPDPGAPGYDGCKVGNSSALQGTNFADTGSGNDTNHGASAWMKTQAPVSPGGLMYLRFAIWDSGDGLLDSTVLIDGFRWSTSEVAQVSTTIDPADGL